MRPIGFRDLAMASTASLLLSFPAAAQSADTADQTSLMDQMTALKAQMSALEAQMDARHAHHLSSPKHGTISFGNVQVTIGGMFEAATIYRSRSEGADIGTSYAKIPFANDRAARSSEFRISPRQSRLTALIQSDIAPGLSVSGYTEFDLQGAAQTANAVESSGYNPRVRVFYGTMNWESEGLTLLAGQNWSLATMNAHGISLRGESAPPGIDAQYVPGFVWARQPQVRVTKSFDDGLAIAVSLENPQTTFGNLTVPTGVSLTDVQAPVSGFYSGTNYSLNTLPDVIAKGAWDGLVAGHHTHFEMFGIYRAFHDRVMIAPNGTNQAGTLGLASGNANRTANGYGVGGSIITPIIPGLLDVQGSMLAGEGIGRYGSGQLPDVTVRPDGQFGPLPEVMMLAGLTLHATPTFDLYAFAGEEREAGRIYAPAALPGVTFGNGTLAGSNNAGCLVEGGSCNASNKAISQVTTGFWKKLYQGSWGRVQVGAQYSYTERSAFADSVGLAPRGVENMVFTSFRYFPF